MFRKFLFWSHLTAGVFAGVVVVIMSITGVALTYQKQMTEWADSAYWPPSGSSVDGAALSVHEIVANAGRLFPDARPSAIRFYSDPTYPAVVTVGGDAVYVNRQDGVVSTGTATSTRAFFRLMTDWHRWLADDTRSWGRALTGASNLAFLFIVATGLYLWIPRNWTWPALRQVAWFRRGLGPRARDFNWHNVAGIWTAIPLILVVASGVVISYPWASDLVYAVTGTDAPVRSPRGGGGTSREPERQALSLEGLDRHLVEAEKQVPTWRTMTLTLPAAGDRDVRIAVDESFGGQPQSRTTLVLDRHRAEVLTIDTFGDQNIGQRTRSWLRFVHTGEYYGLAGQTVAGLASLAAVLLVYTGFAMSLRRWQAWRRRKGAVG